MSYDPLPQELRLYELLADRAVQGLSEAEAEELRGLQREFPSLAWQAEGYSAFDLAAAAADLAMSGDRAERMPEAVRRRLEQRADQFITERKRAPIGLAGAPDDRSTPENPWRIRAPWLLAAAALALAAAGWWARWAAVPAREGREQIARVERALSTSGDTVRSDLAPWAHDNATAECPQVTGRVVWSDTAQAGVLTLTGLPPLRPGVEEYQLWIIDAARGMDQRISGGVFRQTAPGEASIAIEPRLLVKRAAAFAVTVEQPGGTWVSDMKRRVAIATVTR